MYLNKKKYFPTSQKIISVFYPLLIYFSIFSPKIHIFIYKYPHFNTKKITFSSILSSTFSHLFSHILSSKFPPHYTMSGFGDHPSGNRGWNHDWFDSDSFPSPETQFTAPPQTQGSQFLGSYRLPGGRPKCLRVRVSTQTRRQFGRAPGKDGSHPELANRGFEEGP